MKTKERQEGKVTDVHKLGKGYKIITKCLDIPKSTGGSIVRKCVTALSHPGITDTKPSLKTQRQRKKETCEGSHQQSL